MFDDRLRKLRESKGITQNEVANSIGISQRAYANYERDEREPNAIILLKIAKFFSVTTDYLLGYDMDSNDKIFISYDIIRKYNSLDKYGKEAVDNLLDTEYKRCEAEKKPPIIMFRRLSTNKASAGCGYDLSNADEWREIDVIDTPEARQADFAVEIDGASMEPTYYDGDILYIQIAKEIPVGKIGLFMKGGKGYIKEYGKDRLISHNDDYDDIYPDNEIIECIGRVIGVAELP